MAFNEDSRVKIPAIQHLIRLGYTHFPRKEQHWLEKTNIFPDLFREIIAIAPVLVAPTLSPDAAYNVLHVVEVT